MFDRRFDALTKILGGRRSRRSFVTALAGAVTAAITVDTGSAQAHRAVSAQAGASAGGETVERYYLAVAT
jgi:hypothetical protein